jgi:23S rRNA (adenine-N6)-dimethyltransferase
MLRVMKRLHTYSQHFLRDPNFVAELVGHSNLRKNDTVYDLGAGSGVISYVLSRRVKQVFAVELEPSVLAKLRSNLDACENVTIVHSDILSVEFPQVERYKIFANIPFDISSALVRKLVDSPNPPVSCYLVVQKQFANKLLANDRHFTSQLGAYIAPVFAARIRRPLKKTDFWPHPAVDTVLFELKRREDSPIAYTDMPSYERFVERGFADKKFFDSLLRSSLQISAEKLPSQLTGEQWVNLFVLSKR